MGEPGKVLPPAWVDGVMDRPPSTHSSGNRSSDTPVPQPGPQSLLTEPAPPEELFPGFAPVNPEDNGAAHPITPQPAPVIVNPAFSLGPSPPFITCQADKTRDGWEVVQQPSPVMVSKAPQLASNHSYTSGAYVP